MKVFFKSFVYAFKGLGYCLVNERNMRVHFCCLGYMLFFLLRYDFFTVSKTQWSILVLAAALVIVAEYINTAVERAVDTAAKGEKSESAKIAKDTAAGAVLIAAFFAVAVGILILYQPSAFKAMFDYYVANPLNFAFVLSSIILIFGFVIAGPKKIIEIFRRK